MNEEYNDTLELPMLPEEQIELTKKRNKRIFRIKWVLIFILFFSGFIMTDMVHVWYHEHAHAAIYDEYGVKYTYGWKFDGLAIAFYVQTNDSSIRNCNEVCISLQMENELISYNIAYVFYGTWILFFIYLVKCFWEDIIKQYELYNRNEKYKDQRNLEANT